MTACYNGSMYDKISDGPVQKLRWNCPTDMTSRGYPGLPCLIECDSCSLRLAMATRRSDFSSDSSMLLETASLLLQAFAFRRLFSLKY